MAFPAAMMSLTASGADSGATAVPSGSSVASSAGADAVATGAVGAVGTAAAAVSGAVPPDTAPSAAGAVGATAGRCSPASTARRSSAESSRLIRPSTGRPVSVSHSFTRTVVTGPYWPSIAVFTPQRVRKSWSTRTSCPRAPICSGRSPKVRFAAMASVAGTRHAQRTQRATANVRRRDN
jgi:hypothetical protein